MTVGVLAFLAAGCSMLSFGRDEPRASAPEPIAAVPSGSVTGGTLPPPGTTTDPMVVPPAPGTAAAPVDAGMQTASATPAGATPATASVAPGTLGRTDLLGGWTISAAGDSCQLFMTLTTWAGGYRASTRGCTNPALQTISAWNMDGGQVQLFNDAGTTLARLYPASKTLFNGQTEGGGPVTVSR
jgi:hypothetical protein